jgi:tetratricopeptide (TPR) repeat protein
METLGRCLIFLISILFHIAPLEVLAQPASPERGQIDYLRIGNDLLAQGRLGEAEDIFRKAVAAEPDNLIFRSQLAFVLIQEQKYHDADPVLESILLDDPRNLGALWYRSYSRFEEGRYREAISGFGELLPQLRSDPPRFSTANWLIAASYRARLPQDGLSFAEVDLMVQHYSTYLETAGPSAQDRNEVKQFLEWVKKQRPPKNVERWVVVRSAEDAVKALQRSPE